jgi:hypothetical protein
LSELKKVRTFIIKIQLYKLRFKFYYIYNVMLDENKYGLVLFVINFINESLMLSQIIIHEG